MHLFEISQGSLYGSAGEGRVLSKELESLEKLKKNLRAKYYYYLRMPHNPRDVPVHTAVSPPRTCDTDTYDQVQDAVNCVVATEGATGGSLAQAVMAAQVVNSIPQSCMGPYLDAVNCNTPLTQAQRDAALVAFEETTGYMPYDLTDLVNGYTQLEIKMLNFIAYYIFIPIIVLTLIVCWILAGFGIIGWQAAFWYSTLVVVILMMFKIAFSLNGQWYIRNQNAAILEGVTGSQTDFDNAIAYFPAAQYSVACAVVGEDWTCNCSPCMAGGGGQNNQFTQKPKSAGKKVRRSKKATTVAK